MIPWGLVIVFALNAMLAAANVFLRCRWLALLHGVMTLATGVFLALALNSWWECRDGRPPVTTTRPDGSVHVDRLCPGQSVDLILDLSDGAFRAR